jgi:hypothetical protein
MPFFYSTLSTTLLERKEKVDELKQRRYCCSANGLSLGIHFTQTLDEYCNPNMGPKILDIRNADQVVLRYQTNQLGRRRRVDELLRVVTVPQAWLWKVNDMIVTAVPLEVRESLYRSLAGSLMGLNSESDSSKDQAYWTLGLLLSDLVNILDRPFMAGLSEPIFNIFEKAIADLSEAVNKYIKDTAVDTINIDTEKQFLHEIDDIRDELSMIKTILFQQEEVWREFAQRAWPLYWPDGPDGLFRPPESPEKTESTDPWRLERLQKMWNKIQRPQSQFAKFKRRIAKLDADAERVERAIDRKLDLKTKHASLNEAHTMAIMSAAVFGFTIITIIFTPLSFIVALFSLPVDRFQQQQIPSVWTDQAGMYSTNYVGKWIGEYNRYSSIGSFANFY